MPYRRQASPSGGLAALTARLRAVEAKVTKDFWRAIPDAAQAEVAELRRACGELRGEAAIEAHVRLVALVESLVERLPAFEESWSAAPDAAPADAIPPPGGFAQPRSALALSRKLDPAAVLEPDGPDGVVSFRAHDCPFALQVARIDATTTFVGLATGVPSSTAHVEVELGGAFDDLKAAFGIGDDVEIGEDEIDALFRIRGEPAHARALLGPPVRSALRMLAGIGLPKLVTGGRRAVITWRGEAPTMRQLDRTAHALAWIRKAPPTLPLRTAP